MDTQWPRYEVFEQERPGGPHRNAGSVHAPDPELALLNARDVFVRRPDCHSLWVAPAAAIFSRTAEALAQMPVAASTAAPSERPPQAYQVFQKQTQRQGETFVVHVGTVEAQTPEEALALARERYADGPVYVWWVIPERAIARSDPAEAVPWFDPARHKPFRLPNDYQVHKLMRAVTASQTPEAPPQAPEDAGDA